MDRKAFSLIELMVVVVIIGIFLAIVLPQVAGFIMNAKIERAKNDLKNFVKLLKVYKKDKGVWPTTMEDLYYEGYIDSKDDLLSPFKTKYHLSNHFIYATCSVNNKVKYLFVPYLNMHTATFRESCWNIVGATVSVGTYEGLILRKDANVVLNIPENVITAEVEFQLKLEPVATMEITLGNLFLNIRPNYYWYISDGEDSTQPAYSLGRPLVGGVENGQLKFTVNIEKNPEDGMYEYNGKINSKIFELKFESQEKLDFKIKGGPAILQYFYIDKVDFSAGELGK